MKKFIFAVRDRASLHFMDPFAVTHKGIAERSFADAVNDPATPMNKHPEDYDLYELGTFDDGTGLYEVRVPEQISIGKDVYKPARIQGVQEDAFPSVARR